MTGGVTTPGPIRITDVSRRFDNVAALAGLSLVAGPGESVALLGPNGSGKSTLLSILSGLDRPDDGSIDLGGGIVGAVQQRSALDPVLTVRENLTLHAALGRLGRQQSSTRVASLADAVGLADRLDARVGTLSGGLARRCDLARALLHEPNVLLLDEPTAGLDAGSRRAFLEHIDRERAARSMTVIHATHHADEGERVDRVIVLSRGRVVGDAAPGALLEPLGERVVEPTGDPDAATALLRQHGLPPIETTHGPIARLDDAATVAALLGSGLDVRIRRPTLDDVQGMLLAETAISGSPS